METPQNIVVFWPPDKKFLFPANFNNKIRGIYK
jgi:hypothetical protein